MTLPRLGPCALVLLLHAAAAGALRDEVEIEIRKAGIDDAIVAVSVRDADTGIALVSINAGTLLVPASNLKLFTTGAALHVLGPQFEFRTRLLRDGGRLIVVGDGDPGFGDPALLELMQLGDRRGIDVETFLELWVDAVRATGMESVAELLVDDRIFDRRFVHPTWPADQLNRRYCAEVAGFNFHGNVLHFYPRPAQGTHPDLSLVHPAAPWLEITNQATTRTGVHDRNDIWIARARLGNTLTFYGNVKYAYRTPVPVTVHDMPAFFARLVADRLERAGVRVERHGVVDLDAPPSAGTVLAPIVGTPLSTVVARCNRDSQNLYAEALLKRAAWALTNEPGSWTAGAAVVRHVVHERLGDPNLAMDLVVRDGSGLSRENRVAAATVTAWLNSFHGDSRLGDVFVESLAGAGRSGTLEDRFRGVDLHGTEVRAKSGYIRHVSCLSGYVTADDGRRRTFSILVNELREPGSVARAKKLQERILSAVAWDLAAAPVSMGSDE